MTQGGAAHEERRIQETQDMYMDELSLRNCTGSDIRSRIQAVQELGWCQDNSGQAVGRDFGEGSPRKLFIGRISGRNDQDFDRD